MCIILTLTFRMVSVCVKYKYANGTASCDFIVVGSSNIYLFCHHLREIGVCWLVCLVFINMFVPVLICRLYVFIIVSVAVSVSTCLSVFVNVV